MAATGKTPILLYGSTTATNTPSAGNLTNSSDGCEIAINVADKNLFFKDSTNAVNTVPIRQSSASSNGWLSSTDWSTFNGKAPSFTYTTGYIPFGQGTTTPTQSANLFWDNTNVRLGVGTNTPAKKTVIGGVAATSTTIGGREVSLLLGVTGFNAVNTGPELLFGNQAGAATDVGAGISYNLVGVGSGASNWGDLLFSTKPNAAASLTEGFRLTSGGNVSIANGNLVIGTSGKGIDFSATAGTGTSELLADYEEGTWTPTISSASGTCTFVSGSGVYTKIGRMVYVSVNISFSTNASVGTSNLTIGGLPYASTAPSSFALVSTDYSIVDYGTGGANGFVSIGGSGSSFVHQVRTVDISSRAAFSWSYSGYYQTT